MRKIQEHRRTEKWQITTYQGRAGSFETNTTKEEEPPGT